MGSLETACQIHDLAVTRHRSSLIFSPEPSERKSMFLSNIDQVLDFDVQTIHFFSAHPDYPPELATRKIELALEKLLVPYGFMAGRMKLNPEKARLEFDCNNAGIGFVVASSPCTIEEIGDLVYPNPAFEDLVTRRLGSGSDHPLCIVQTTSFKCGGFAMGVQTNHATLDGAAFKTFLENLGAVAGDKPLAVTPCNDRELLAARDPPQVTFPHPELLKLNTAMGQAQEESQSSPNVFETTSNDLDFKVFRLSPEDINGLKKKACLDMGPSPKAKVTGFNVVAAHIWRCRALSFEPERESTLLFAIDIRRRLNPPLPEEFTGNAVLTAYATVKKSEMETAALGRLVEMVTEGSERMNDEYARSVIDWGEANRGFPNGEFLISSWWRLGLDRVQYPWGRPKYSFPLVHKRKDIVLLFPDCDSGGSAGGGVNVLVALPHKEMVEFERLFQKL
ncbi:hypothetical protein V2J09_000901 [Rumex salicifolius]